MSYAVDFVTLKSPLEVLSSNVDFKVADVWRFQQIVEAADGSLRWLEWAQEVLGLGGDRCVLGNGPDAVLHGGR